jgi:hypothetical protein
MWPPGERAELSDYKMNGGKASRWSGLLGAFRR